MSKTVHDPILLKNIKEYLTVYLPIVKKRSRHTVSSSKDSLNSFIRYLSQEKNISLAKLSRHDFNQKNLLDFQTWMQRPDSTIKKVSSINQRMSRLRGFCQYLVKNDVLDLISNEEIKDISPVKDKEPREFIYLTKEQLKLVLKQPNLTKKTGIRDRFFLALMYESGCRVDELLHLKIKDFTLNKDGEGSISIFGKGSKYRCTPLSKNLTPIYQEYLSHYHSDTNKHSDDLMFYTIRNGIKAQMSSDNVQRFLNTYEKSARKIDKDLPHLHPHLFRRTRAMHLYMSGTPLPLVQEWLGHSNEETTRIYAKATDDMKRKALQKLGEQEDSIIDLSVQFKYSDDESVLKKLAGLK